MENSAHTMEEMPLLWLVVYINTSYFVIVEVGEKNIRTHCKLCAGSKTARNITFNFKKHLNNDTQLAVATYTRVCN